MVQLFPLAYLQTQLIKLLEAQLLRSTLVRLQLQFIILVLQLLDQQLQLLVQVDQQLSQETQLRHTLHLLRLTHQLPR